MMPPKPKVVKIVAAFCVAMALLNVGLAYGAHWASENIQFILRWVDPEFPFDMPGYEEMETMLRRTLVAMVFTSAFFVPLNLWLAWAKPLPRIYHLHLVNLLLGAASCIGAPVAIPLFLAWLKPEVRAYFDVPPRPTAAER